MSIFHLFPSLPAELRLAIWRKCLPCRTYELDIPIDDVVFDFQAPSPCKLWDTTYANGRPPVISRVCRESRAVAFETGQIPLPSQDIPVDAQWWSGNIASYSSWTDYARDSVHLNWSPAYHADFPSSGSALHCLAWHATYVRYGGSLMMYFLTDSIFHKKYLRIDALMRVPRWAVVMRVVVLHANFRTAAATGLFGLLGDARVQVVDMSNEARVNAFFDLGKKSEFHVVDVSDKKIPIDPFDLLHESEHQSHITDGQDLQTDSVDSYKQILRKVIVKTLGSEVSVPPMYPAIMFRLCTRMCNHLGDVENNPSITSTQTRGGRGRGSGRGRGVARGRGRGG